MAEIVTEPLPAPRGIFYADDSLKTMQHRYSRLKPIEPGDVCCNCGLDCDGPGFSISIFKAYRVQGHPICARFKCHDAKMDEFVGKRIGCGCGRRKR
jgi:hypothetical protein